MTSLVLLVIGPDRPGLVEILSNSLAEHGGSWRESRMARLSGYFAGILQVEVPADRVESASRLLRELKEQGLEVFIQQGQPQPAAGRRHAHLDLVGTDRPGIIQRISSGLARHAVNVDQLETEVTTAPMSGEPIFRARADLRLPDAVDVSVLRGTLEAIGADLMVDLKLEEESDEEEE
ncbi:MAG: glycine cleavage system protein R [Myxococcota bacterium]